GRERAPAARARAGACAATRRALAAPAPAPQAPRRALAPPPLADLLERTTAHAERAGIEDADLLRALGLDGAPRTAQEVWRALFDRHLARDGGGAQARPALQA